jgi:hypothetical protein
VKTQGDVRASFSGRREAKSIAAVVGPGSKGHRILRRVPADGRHPGLHGSRAVTGAGLRQSRRLSHTPKGTAKAGSSRVQEREATGMSEARS